MVSTVTSFTALFSAVFMMLMGVGLLGTLLSLRMTQTGFSTQVTGFVLAAYFIGLLIGSLTCQRLIQRVGHIRAFAALASVITATVMLHAMYISAPFWCVLRFISGFAQIGLYMVIESWLNECAAPEARGRVFSVYMTCTYLGLSVGQLLLNLGDCRGPIPFFITGILFSVCAVPVALTRAVHPERPQGGTCSFLSILKEAPMGMTGCMVSGLVNSSFYAMAPVLGSRIGLSVPQVSGLMSAIIFGGLICQWPLGIVSDRSDRSALLPILGILSAGVSLAMMAIGQMAYPLLLLGMGIYGGMMFAVYPIAVARAYDTVRTADVVSVSSALLLVYGIGASLGPIVSSTFMAGMNNPFGLFAYSGIVYALFAGVGFCLRRWERHPDFAVKGPAGFAALEPSAAGLINPVTVGEPHAPHLNSGKP